MDIPNIFDVVQKWDERVRSALPTNALWYSPLARDGMSLAATTEAVTRRYDVIEEDVRLICKSAGIEYQSPHKLRHGHVVWGLKRARTIEELKAISQNVMHSSITITDGIYGNLVKDDVRTVISQLGKQNKNDQAELLRLIEQLKAQLT